MDFFEDRTHVRLRNREQGTYLHADENGWSVSLSPHRASLNTAWAVHLVTVAQLGTYVLLYSAAYGRYLGVRDVLEYAPPHGNPAFFSRMVQCLYNAPLQIDIMWEAQSTEDGSGDVLLSPLRRQNPWGNSPWTVQRIPPRAAPPQLPNQAPNGVAEPVVLGRMIQYFRADNFGIFILTRRPRTLQFEHRSLIDLRGDLANLLDDNINNITLCVRGGFLGHITPLVVDLPFCEETLDIVVLTTGSPAAMELQHPDVDAV